MVPSITASEFPETGVALESLDPDLREFCERQNISIVVDEDSSNNMDSNSSSSEDRECLDSFEEIVKPSELKLFSIFLKKAKGAALEGQHTRTSRRTYTGHSWTTQYHRRKLCTDHISKGFLPMDQYMEQMEKKKLTIAICKELEDGSVSHSNTSQGHALQEEEESDTP